MRKLILLFLFSIVFFSYSNGQEKSKTILAIFAHTDDESSIGKALAKYSKQAKVYVIYVVEDIDTSGIDVAPTGDSINHVKIAEAKCSCKKLNIQPIFLGMGRLIYDPRNKPREYFIKTKKLKEILQQKITELKPDVLITFGPDGDSGHPEHRIVSGIVTELILFNGWVDQYPLYYAGWPKEAIPQDQIEGTGELDTKYLNVAIQYSEEDEATAFDAFSCYKKEFSPQLFQQRKEEDAAEKTNIFYFRQFVISNKRKTDLFKK